MTKNVIQFAPIFDAVGAKLNLDTTTLDVQVTDYPKGKKKLVNDAVDEVSHYLDTRTYDDGLAIFAIADTIDGEPTPIPLSAKGSILEALGLVKDGKYIAQVIALQKVNKAWHSSEVPNECSWFGDICTNRGTVEVAGKRGRKSTRSPYEYHEQKANGTINREQLVSPSLEALHRAIPENMVVSATKNKSVFRLDEIDSLDADVLQSILDKINLVREKAS